MGIGYAVGVAAGRDVAFAVMFFMQVVAAGVRELVESDDANFSGVRDGSSVSRSARGAQLCHAQAGLGEGHEAGVDVG
ncbi:hypothetical protein I6A60_11340 [Frankia sp. AgB1.9]|uniref:hypothetical protein n=1 Tax=unclassified Frankia TaxID=2632575 RepID=UPI001933E48F|nr:MULTISPECIES: hypothetical protein [unclassified Frankia]MBL7548463.1 hypothetical protein [Frankia sp. AgB1.9]